MRPYRQPGSPSPEPDKTPVVLTYGPFTLRKDELGKWSLDAPASFGAEDIDKLGALAQWARQTIMDRQMGVFEPGVVLGGPLIP